MPLISIQIITSQKINNYFKQMPLKHPNTPSSIFYQVYLILHRGSAIAIQKTGECIFFDNCNITVN